MKEEESDITPAKTISADLLAMGSYPPFEVKGKKFLRGTAGSLVLECVKCVPAVHHFREPGNFFDYAGCAQHLNHKCLVCGSQMRPIEVV